MTDFLKNGLKKLAHRGKKAVKQATSEASLRTARHQVASTRASTEDAARAVAQAPATQVAIKAAGHTIRSGPVKQVAYMCGRAGVAGAVVDGSMGSFQAIKAVRDGRIDSKQAVIHTGAEAGCGFVTSSSGTAGTIAAYMLTGTMGPAALAAGMGASVGSRYIYRQLVGETLPEESSKQSSKDDGSVMEPIGRKKKEDAASDEE